jgi:alpha-galactosidase
VEPYLLTPQERLAPLINAPKVIGFGKSHPVLYHIPITGKKPLQINVSGLPKGLSFNDHTGIISGQIDEPGEFLMTVKATNSYGSDKQRIMLNVGDKIALTPPMGWNSWNCYGLAVSSDNIKISAQAMIKKGLLDYGWSYINIDDGWQAKERRADGEIQPNVKFPDMSLLGNYLHEQGLKFGIYSSPGAKTCGGFLGSLGYEGKDASTYSRWGVDYLKYDLCSYSDNIGTDTTLYAQQKPYLLMRDELKRQHRDIIYSLCQYGIKDVWKWGSQMNGNSWRTTEDITDTWESLYHIDFHRTGLPAMLTLVDGMMLIC